MYKMVNNRVVSGKNICDVLETESENLIYKNISQSFATVVCRHFNLGGGFDGWTPKFFLSEYTVNH